MHGLTAHLPAADDKPWLDSWLVAACAYFVDSLRPFRRSFGCVLLSNHIYLTTMYRSTMPLRFIWSIWPGKCG